MPASPEALFLRYRTTGHPEPLGELFDRVGPQLLALALHRCGHPADAEDALQATFVAAIDQRHRWDAQRPLLPWLGGVLDKQCRRIGQRRVRRREQELPPEPLHLDDGTPLAASERADLVARVRQHVDRLPAEQRQVLLLQLEHGLAPAEVADVLGVPPGTVRMRLHRAVQTLRAVLPATLVALVLAALPSRGVAAVRAAVIHHAATAVVAGGALFAKKVALAAAVALLLVGVTAWAPWTHNDTQPTGRRAVVAASTAFAPEPTPLSTNDAATAGRESVAAAASGFEAAARATAALRVVAVNASDRTPVARLPLRVVWLDSDVDTSNTWVSAATAADGTAVFAALPPGRIRVHGAAPGRVDGVLRGGGETTLELVVAVTPTVVRGLVRHADGRVAAGATLVAGQPYEAYAEPVAVADAAGGFVVSLPNALLMIGARLDGCGPSALRALPTDGTPVEITLGGPDARVDGIAVAADGAPVADARIEIGGPRGDRSFFDEPGNHWEHAPPQRLRTGADGRFAVRGLRGGEVGIAVRADGFAPFHRYVTLQPGASYPLRCELQRGLVVVGRVVDGRGEAVAGTRVCFGGSYGEVRTTDASGRFAFRGVPRGPQQLRVEGDDVVTRFVEREAEATHEWLVAVERALLYRLRFVDERAQPLAGWQVCVRSVFERVTTTDGDGRVGVWAAGDGPFELRIGAPGHLQATITCAWPAALAGVEGTVVVPASARPTAIVRGRLLGADGAPFAGAWLALQDGDGRFVVQRGQTAAGFEIADVAAGDFVLSLAREQLGCALVRVPVPQLQRGEVRDLGDVRLPAEGRLRVQVCRADGSPARDAKVFVHNDAREEARVPSDGLPHAMPVGRYRWQVLDDDSLWQRGEIAVVAGATASLDLVLQPGVRRYLRFPVPTPDWGTPRQVAFVLRAPDGSVYDQDDFDPRQELPYVYMPALACGTWRLELVTDDGRRFAGAFAIDSLAPSRTPMLVAVAPSR